MNCALQRTRQSDVKKRSTHTFHHMEQGLIQTVDERNLGRSSSCCRTVSRRGTQLRLHITRETAFARNSGEREYPILCLVCNSLGGGNHMRVGARSLPGDCGMGFDADLTVVIVYYGGTVLIDT